MAKRQADDQKTKDDHDDDGSDEPGTRDTPIAPVSGRVVRGLPKRRGLGGTAASAAAPPPQAPVPGTSSASAPVPANPFGGFSFGAPKPATSQPFAFGASSTPAAPAHAAASPFSGFSFGKSTASPAAAPAATTSTFSFGTKPADAAPAAAASKPFAGFSFGGSAASASPAAAAPTPAFGAPKPSSTPAAASTAPGAAPFSAAKSQSDFSQSSTSGSAAPASASVVNDLNAADQGLSKPTASSQQDPPPTPPSEGETSYYTSLLGLNTSLIKFLTSTLDADSFTDLSLYLPSLLKQYEKHLEEAAKKAGWSPEGEKKPAANGAATKPPAPPASGFFVPSVPAAGSGGFTLPKASGGSGSGASGGGGSSGGFKFTPAATAGGGTAPSGFTLPASGVSTPAPATSTPLKPSSAAVNKLVGDAISNKEPEQAKSAVAEDKPEPLFHVGGESWNSQTAKKPTTLFSFGSSSKPTNPSASTTESTPGPTAPLGKFGPGGVRPQLSFGGAKASAPNTPTAGGEAPFSFGAKPAGGASAGFSFGAGSGSGVSASAAKPTTFSFGGSAPAAPAPAPGAFSFGGASSGTSSFSFGGASAAPKSTPAFFTPPSAVTPTSEPSAPASATAGDSSAPSPQDSPSKNLAELGGAGEEDEETVVEARGKLNKLEGGAFKLEGLGQFKLKRGKEEGGKSKRRLLMRTDGNGNVILNMAVKGTYNPTVEGPHLKFLGFDLNGKPVPYALRVKNADAAKTLLDALVKEVEAIKKEE